MGAVALAFMEYLPNSQRFVGLENFRAVFADPLFFTALKKSGLKLNLIAASIVIFTGDIYAGLWYPIGIAALSFLIGLLVLPETKDREIGH